ncbi:hypothetical protein TH53_08730 [Pedobacter lusitanus]|uniref:Uncharacterized protein n=1 Tax=Pedobacter lusitanus TaxID=1503925 RepID=A0A0D0F799_9SPHI|nr:hypothetical protein [Pedobacter lusitanus]KIO77518.1 hypothetical protein TH53_08730 [Pedobacter lusitanus]
MKKFLKNVNTVGLIAILLAGGLIFTQSAFKNVHPDRFATSYFFNGDDNSMIKTPGAWDTQLDLDRFRCELVTNTPCELVIPAGETLEDYLDHHTPQQIIKDSKSRRVFAP